MAQLEVRDQLVEANVRGAELGHSSQSANLLITTVRTEGQPEPRIRIAIIDRDALLQQPVSFSPISSSRSSNAIITQAPALMHAHTSSLLYIILP